MADETTRIPLSDLEAHVGLALETRGAQRYEAALQTIAAAFQAMSATLHRADLASQELHMVAQLGLPEPIIAVTRQIPFGKGIAGLCAAQQKPIRRTFARFSRIGASNEILWSMN